MPASKKSSRPSRATKPSGSRERAREGNGTHPEPVAFELETPAQHHDGSRIERLRELVTILERSSLSELAYEDEDIAVTLRRHAAVSATPVLHAPLPVAVPAPVHAPSHLPQPSAPAASTAHGRAAPKEEPNVFVMKSPFVGTFYRAASPTSAAFCDVGQQVRRGQTVCIIEAMKLMNEIESEVDGKVIDILVENGHPVQYGDALLRIRTKG
jgi:acetyl-CoA carboxylase biotin carboxyl carrier protein